MHFIYNFFQLNRIYITLPLSNPKLKNIWYITVKKRKLILVILIFPKMCFRDHKCADAEGLLGRVLAELLDHVNK